MSMIRTLLGFWALSLFLTATARSADNQDGSVDKEAVNQAIDKGVAYLKQAQGKAGSWSYFDEQTEKEKDFVKGAEKPIPKGAKNPIPFNFNNHYDVGVTSLAGLALLGSGVPLKDPALQNAADFVRKAVPELTFTYSIAAAILFLDRINDANDDLSIKTLAARLLAGQNQSNCWSYDCPQVAADDVRRWKTPEQFLQGTARLRQRVPGGDNSCSQFAVMGLWPARRHQVPVDQALANYENVCRKCQGPDGTFPYNCGMGMVGSSCMTCAGLLGIAYGHGVANEAALLKNAKNANAPKLLPGKGLRDLDKDQALRKGLNALEKTMKKAAARQPAVKRGAKQVREVELEDAVGFEDFGYEAITLWSIERVGVVLDREKIGSVDWYYWGAPKLLGCQKKNGSWTIEGGSPPLDTAFALLFLKRSSPAPDLTLTLKGTLPEPREPASPSDAPPAKQEPGSGPNSKITLPKSQPEKPSEPSIKITLPESKPEK